MTLRIVYMGTPAFAVPALVALLEGPDPVVAVVTRPDAEKGRGHRDRAVPPVKDVALQAGVPVLQPESVRDPDFIRSLASFRPDLVVTAAFGRILPKEVLELPRLGCINIHGSLLPKYRGASPIQACLLNGDAVSGVTLIQMDEGMDSGDILDQASVPVSEDMTAAELSGMLAELGARRLGAILEDLKQGRIRPVPQEASEATFVRKPMREDGRIDWTQPVDLVHNRIRAMTPEPGAFTTLRDRPFKIHRSRIQSREGVHGHPGEIVSCHCGWLEVACGTGSLALLEIQADSGKRLPTSCCAHNYRPGTILGDAAPEPDPAGKEA